MQLPLHQSDTLGFAQYSRSKGKLLFISHPDQGNRLELA